MYALHIALVILMLLAAALSASRTETFALPSSIRVIMPEEGMPYPPWYNQQNYNTLPWSPATNRNINPTTNPAANPTTNPTINPTTNPATNPTTNPTTNPATNPTTNPATTNPTTNPATNPAVTPTGTSAATPANEKKVSTNNKCGPTNGNTFCPDDMCCLSSGFCGKLDFCLDSPFNGPNVKKLTTNDNCGPKYGNTYCAGSLCCSASGWCGTTPEHCGDNPNSKFSGPSAKKDLGQRTSLKSGQILLGTDNVIYATSKQPTDQKWYAAVMWEGEW